MCMDLLAIVAEAFMIVILGWAAVERARAHRHWNTLRRELSRDAAAARTTDWCMAPRPSPDVWDSNEIQRSTLSRTTPGSC